MTTEDYSARDATSGLQAAAVILEAPTGIRRQVSVTSNSGLAGVCLQLLAQVGPYRTRNGPGFLHVLRAPNLAQKAVRGSGPFRRAARTDGAARTPWP